MSQTLIFTPTPGQAIDDTIRPVAPSAKTFILTDANTSRLCLPRLRETSACVRDAAEITIPAGDVNKNLDSLSHVWHALVDGGATRGSLLVNLGGGMVTDLGGFAAATFKRGIRFINVPTTLLSAVDAAVGGKTGINFLGLKNEIGAFREADAVVISTGWYDTMPREELLSGYGEMLKHGLLSSEEAFTRLLSRLPELPGHDELLALLEESVEVKRRVVAEDPTEKGLRKALNLGHTPGHAFESWAMKRQRPVPHGYAVAWGLVVDLTLSHLLHGFSSQLLQQAASAIKEAYGSLPVTCADYDALIDLMRHDKKNATADAINFTLLDAPGRVHLDCIVPAETIRQALDLFCDLTQ